MQTSVSFGTLSSDQRVGVDLPKDDTPFRIAVLGDFSGRAARGLTGSSEEIGRRRARKVDRGNLDDLIVKSAPALELDLGAAGGNVSVAFRSLDDFHPDALHAHVPAFADAFDRDEKTALMNAILHHPAVQSLESAWRGVDWLLQEVAKVKSVEVRLIDLSADELIADLSSTDRLEETGLYQILVDQPASRGDLDPWSILVGLYLFEPTAAHAGVLGRVGRIARQASAPFLSGVAPVVLGPSFAPDEDDAEAWGQLRQLPESSMLGLVTPRFLLRPPYGEATRTIDAFEYEEYAGPAGWGGYLWGSSALACASLLARSFAREGWGFRPGSVLDLGGMVMHVTRDEDDEPVSVLAEARLVRPAAERLSALGLMPLLCVKGRDAAELADFRSLSRPAKGEASSPLLGRWGQKGTVTLPRSGSGTKVSAAPTRSATPPPPSPSLYGESPFYSEIQAPPEPTQFYSEIQAPPEPAEEMDPDLAAMMAEPAAPAPAEAATEVEEEMDPELAALMADLDAPAPAEAPAEVEEVDPELAALMAELDAPAEAEAEVPAEVEEEDPELAALMAELDAPAEVPEAAEAAPEDEDEELKRLMEELG